MSNDDDDRMIFVSCCFFLFLPVSPTRQNDWSVIGLYIFFEKLPGVSFCLFLYGEASPRLDLLPEATRHSNRPSV